MAKDEEKIVSIIIPVFNRKSIVIETLDFLISQTYTHWEAILVDDGSTDGTLEILKDYNKNDNRIKIFTRNRPPKGAQTCRNIGLEKSTGNYIIFLDSDDLLASYCLEQRIRYMEENPEMDFAVFPIIIFDKEPIDTLKYWNIFTDERDLDRFIRYDVVWQTSSPIYKRTFVQKLNWDELLISGQDWDYHVKALALNPTYEKVNTLPDCFIRRDSSDRISYRFFDPPEIMNRAISLQMIYNLLKKKNLWKKKYNIPYTILYFSLAKILVKTKDFQFNVKSFFSPVIKNRMIGFKDYYIMYYYLLGLKKYQNDLEKRNKVRKYFSRFLPEYLNVNFYNVTQEKVKMEDKCLQEFLKRNSKLIKNNNQFNYS
ncbi:hypothetical protein BH23BAC1_BH23BAC1_15550 [soil metagenome]